jgi:hypothetical protein
MILIGSVIHERSDDDGLEINFEGSVLEEMERVHNNQIKGRSRASLIFIAYSM